jgi:hypothetical protein
MENPQDPERVFEIEFIAPVLPDIWAALGRAYIEIQAGNTVAIEVVDSSGEKQLSPFKVVAASIFGYLLSGLDQGHTGSLTIVAQGSKADLATYQRQFHGAKFLVSYPH